MDQHFFPPSFQEQFQNLYSKAFKGQAYNAKYKMFSILKSLKLHKSKSDLLFVSYHNYFSCWLSCVC